MVGSSERLPNIAAIMQSTAQQRHLWSTSPGCLGRETESTETMPIHDRIDKRCRSSLGSRFGDGLLIEEFGHSRSEGIGRVPMACSFRSLGLQEQGRNRCCGTAVAWSLGKMTTPSGHLSWVRFAQGARLVDARLYLKQGVGEDLCGSAKLPPLCSAKLHATWRRRGSFFQGVVFQDLTRSGSAPTRQAERPGER